MLSEVGSRKISWHQQVSICFSTLCIFEINYGSLVIRMDTYEIKQAKYLSYCVLMCYKPAEWQTETSPQDLVNVLMPTICFDFHTYYSNSTMALYWGTFMCLHNMPRFVKQPQRCLRSSTSLPHYNLPLGYPQLYRGGSNMPLIDHEYNGMDLLL